MNLERVFSAITAEDVPALLGLFHDGHATVHMPSFGTISNDRIFRMFVTKVANRLRRLNVTAAYLGEKTGDGVLIAEYVLSYKYYDEERDTEGAYVTPTALVCDLAADGRIAAMTVYAGLDKLVGKEIIRPAFLNADSSIVLPAAVAACYEADKPDTLTEACRVRSGEGWLAVEENVLMTQSAICTPQAQLSVFDLAADGTPACRRTYSEVVWDFKLWPTLY